MANSENKQQHWNPNNLHMDICQIQDVYFRHMDNSEKKTLTWYLNISHINTLNIYEIFTYKKYNNCDNNIVDKLLEYI